MKTQYSESQLRAYFKSHGYAVDTTTMIFEYLVNDSRYVFEVQSIVETSTALCGIIVDYRPAGHILRMKTLVEFVEWLVQLKKNSILNEISRPEIIREFNDAQAGQSQTTFSEIDIEHCLKTNKIIAKSSAPNDNDKVQELKEHEPIEYAEDFIVVNGIAIRKSTINTVGKTADDHTYKTHFFNIKTETEKITIRGSFEIDEHWSYCKKLGTQANVPKTFENKMIAKESLEGLRMKLIRYLNGVDTPLEIDEDYETVWNKITKK